MGSNKKSCLKTRKSLTIIRKRVLIMTELFLYLCRLILWIEHQIRVCVLDDKNLRDINCGNGYSIKFIEQYLTNLSKT